jgi:hypothetical protein
MVDIVTLGIIFLILMLVASFVVIVFTRKQKAIKVQVKELGNPKGTKIRKHYGFFDKKMNRWNLYPFLIWPLKDGIAPPFIPNKFIEDGVVKTVRGASDDPDDDMIVPIHPVVVGQAGARQMIQEVRDALIDRLSNGVDDVDVKVKVKKRDGTEYEVTRKVSAKFTDKDLADKLDKLITYDWVCQTFGIVPVEDVNVILASEKDAIATFNSTINDKVNSKQSFMKQNAMLLLFIMGMFVIFIGAAVEYDVINQHAPSATTTIPSVLGVNISTKGSTTTIIPPKNATPPPNFTT